MAERVVFDTNIWISGLMWRGKPYQCLLLARTGVVQALYCQEIVAELTHKLRQVFGFSENHISGNPVWWQEELDHNLVPGMMCGQLRDLV